jgi:hypothetical protein
MHFARLNFTSPGVWLNVTKGTFIGTLWLVNYNLTGIVPFGTFHFVRKDLNFISEQVLGGYFGQPIPY